MRRITGLALTIVAVLAANVIATGTASAAKLTLSEGGVALPPGDYFELTGSQNLEVTTSDGRLFCNDPFTGMEVSVMTNSKSADQLRIEELYLPQDPLVCQSNVGYAYVSLHSLGSVLTLRSNGKATSGPGVALSIQYAHTGEADEGINCVYRSKRLTGTNNATPDRQQLRVDIGGRLRLDVAGSGENARHICPKKVDINLELPSTENYSGEFGAVEEQT